MSVPDKGQTQALIFSQCSMEGVVGSASPGKKKKKSATVIYYGQMMQNFPNFWTVMLFICENAISEHPPTPPQTLKDFA